MVSDKARRVANFHKNTLKALAEMLAAAGLAHPREIKPWHLHIRHLDGRVLRGDDIYEHLAPGAFLRGDVNDELAEEWARAQAESFEPVMTRG